MPCVSHPPHPAGLPGNGQLSLPPPCRVCPGPSCPAHTDTGWPVTQEIFQQGLWEPCGFSDPGWGSGREQPRPTTPCGSLPKKGQEKPKPLAFTMTPGWSPRPQGPPGARAAGFLGSCYFPFCPTRWGLARKGGGLPGGYSPPGDWLPNPPHQFQGGFLQAASRDEKSPPICKQASERGQQWAGREGGALSPNCHLHKEGAISALPTHPAPDARSGVSSNEHASRQTLREHLYSRVFGGNDDAGLKETRLTAILFRNRSPEPDL